MDAATLEKIHEDMVSVVECIAQDLCGEAKGELSSLMSYLEELPETAGRKEIHDAVKNALEKLRYSNQGTRDETPCIRLRHRLYNTLRAISGRPESYAGANVFAIHDL
jgi:hypothetical protein